MKTTIPFAVLFVCGIAASAVADKSAVEIITPAAANPGSTVTITVTVTHSANNFMHFTNQVWIRANGKEIARWDFTWRDLPEGASFNRSIMYTVHGPTVVSAQSNCNLHGSAGERSMTVREEGRP